MFKLTDRFWWPVDLEMPGDGQTRKHRIELQFKRLSQGALDEVVLGWRGVKSDQNEDLPFTPENFAQLLDEVAGARLSIIATYFDAMQGAARRKNLSGLRGIG